MESTGKADSDRLIAVGLAVLAAFTVFITWRAKVLEKALLTHRTDLAIRGKPAPDFSLETLDGRTVKLSDYRGKKVVISAKQRIGFLPENFAFHKHLTAEKVLRYHLELSDLKPDKPDDVIFRLLAQVKLSGSYNQRVGSYSRGMMQRLGIAQALLANPDLLIFDEPTSGLDPAGRKEVRDVILEMKSQGKTVFLSSHILSEVEQICDRVIIVNDGRVVRQGSVRELLESGGRVEIVVDALPELSEQNLVARGAEVSREHNTVHIVVTRAEKREIAEMLWSSGCDVISINPVRSTLEGLFFQLVGGGTSRSLPAQDPVQGTNS